MFSTFSEEFTRELVDHALAASPGKKKRWHVTRLYMYRRLENRLQAEDSPERTALSISHSANLAGLLGLRSVSIEEANFPEHDMTDLRAFADGSFDFVLADQVLEHVAGDPFTAFRECRRVLKPGGLVVQTTCFFNEIHQHPTDYWRFTANALRVLSEDTGMEVTHLGGWGNREAWAYMGLGYRMHKIPEDPDNPIFRLATRQDKKYPIVTWVIAQRPLEEQMTEKQAWTQEQRRLAGGMLPYLFEVGWIESRRRRQSVDREGRPIPWITYPALNFLEARVRPEMSVFEFGSGNSTLWWAERARQVTAVEHDESWAAHVAERMPENVDLSHVPLEPGGDYSRHAQRSGSHYEVIVVDGRDRVNSAIFSVECLSPDGVIVWDNTERSRYAPGLRALSEMGFRRIEFRGPSPINTRAIETSVLYRSENCLGI